MAVQLSDRYRGLDPLRIRQTPAHEVYLLYGRTARRDQRTGNTPSPQKNNKGVIRKKAGDDWF